MVSGRKPDLHRRARIAQMYSRGLSLAEIGRRLGVTKQAVHETLNQMSRPLPRRSVPCAVCAAAIVSDGVLASDRGQAICLTCLASRPRAGLGARVKAFRLAAGLTKTELARRLGVSAMTVHHYETGHREPRWRHLQPLIAALGPGLVTLGLRRAN
jgi:transcriptional regulator with XRE-family HTH domain